MTNNAGDDGLERQLSRLLDAHATRAQRVAALRSLGATLGRGVARPAGLADTVVKLAPTLTPRTLVELRSEHGGASGAQLAHELVRSAARVSGAIGAAAGVLASVTEAAPVALLTAPVQLGVESLAVVAVELKLIAELYVVSGRALPADRMQRTGVMLWSWTTGRGLTRRDLASGPALFLTRAARTQLSDRLLRRFLRASLGFVPLLAGAAAGAALNARGTRKLGRALAADLLQR